MAPLLFRNLKAAPSRVHLVWSTFKAEVEANLFGGQVLHGGVVELLKMAFESMTESGIAPEVAYLETLHGLKTVGDLLFKGGITGLNDSITNNAEFGEYLAGQEIIGDESRAAMRAALKRIKFGQYAMGFIAESGAGYPSMSARRMDNEEHDIEATGAELRELIRWNDGNGF